MSEHYDYYAYRLTTDQKSKACIKRILYELDKNSVSIVNFDFCNIRPMIKYLKELRNKSILIISQDLYYEPPRYIITIHPEYKLKVLWGSKIIVKRKESELSVPVIIKEVPKPQEPIIKWKPIDEVIAEKYPSQLHNYPIMH